MYIGLDIIKTDGDGGAKNGHQVGAGTSWVITVADDQSSDRQVSSIVSTHKPWRFSRAVDGCISTAFRALRASIQLPPVLSVNANTLQLSLDFSARQVTL